MIFVGANFIRDCSRLQIAPTMLAFVVTMSFSVCAADWPQWRGPTGLGFTSEKNLPVKWGGSNGENILWKSPLPKGDNPYSSPIVWRDHVFVTTVLNNPLEHHVICFQKSDGKQLWDTLVPPGPWHLGDLRCGYGAPTPATDGQRVYVLFGSAVIAALDFKGQIVWRKELQKHNFDVGIGVSPILYQDTVILDCDQTQGTSSLIAFGKKTGEVKWEVPRPDAGFAHSTPAIVTISSKPQMLVAASGAVQGVDPSNGKVLWWCQAQGDVCTPAFGGGLVFCDSGRGGLGVAVDPTGTGDVTTTHLKWKIPVIPEGFSSPTIVGDLLFRSHNPEILKCIKLATGDIVYSERLPGLATAASPIATAGGVLYFATAGTSYVVKAGAKLEILAKNDLGDENYASAAVSDGMIFLKGRQNLYCIGEK